MSYCTQRGAFRQSKTRAPKQAASAKKKLALRTQEHSRENKHLRIVSLQSTVSRYFCLSQRSMQHIALPAPKGCTPLCTDAPKLKSVRALVSECSQVWPCHPPSPCPAVRSPHSRCDPRRDPNVRGVRPESLATTPIPPC